MKTLLNSKVGIVLAVAAVGAVAVVVAAKKAEQAVDTTLEAINPVNQDNVFASGVNAVGAKLSGKSNWSLGGWIYDITH